MGIGSGIEGPTPRHLEAVAALETGRQTTAHPRSFPGAIRRNTSHAGGSPRLLFPFSFPSLYFSTRIPSLSLPFHSSFGNGISVCLCILVKKVYHFTFLSQIFHRG